MKNPILFKQSFSDSSTNHGLVTQDPHGTRSGQSWQGLPKAALADVQSSYSHRGRYHTLKRNCKL
ncbi:MAG: hypothetical protein OXE59_09765 [Bacteroidetes bacterium]|nr:hypothetical protein [Bacteroidota bacterium]